MENCTNSTTNCSVPDSTHPVLAGPGFGAYSIVMFSWCIVIIALIIITISALCVAHSVAKLVRVFLINHLVAILVTALVHLGFGLLALILNFTSSPPPDLWLCRVLVFGYKNVFVLRLYSLAAFSVSVLLVVKYSKKTLKPLYIILSLTFIWIIATLLSVRTFIPPNDSNILYYDNVACTIQIIYQWDGEKALATFEEFFGKLVPLIISILVPIVVLCYVRCNTITEGSSYSKGIMKFTFFLVASNLLNVIAYIAVVVLTDFQDRQALYLYSTVSVATIFPSPILVYVFLKPIRDRVRFVICYCCRHPHPVYMANNPACIPLVEKN